MFRLTHALLASVVFSTGNAFVPVSRPTGLNRIETNLNFGLPSFQPKKEDEEPEEKLPKKDLSLGGVVQLITAGMGAPFLGDYEGMDKDGKMMFSLEANNLYDEDGKSKQTSMPYFESGWVDPEDEKKAQEPFKFPWQK